MEGRYILQKLLKILYYCNILIIVYVCIEMLVYLFGRLDQYFDAFLLYRLFYITIAIVSILILTYKSFRDEINSLHSMIVSLIIIGFSLSVFVHASIVSGYSKIYLDELIRGTLLAVGPYIFASIYINVKNKK